MARKGGPTMGDAGSKRRGRRRLVGLGLLVLLGLGGSVGWMVRPPRLGGPPVPDPNGYDTLVAAGKLAQGTPPAQGQAEKATDDELRAFGAANEKALAAAGPGFAQESVVPLARLGSLADHMADLGPTRQLSRVLVCRAVLARREGRTSDAVQAALDLLRLAHAVSHGGLFIDHSLGTAFRRQALAELAGPLLPQLAAEDARRAIAELQRLDRDREPIATLADRDLTFSLSREGWMMRLMYALNRKALDGLTAPALRAIESAERQVQGQARLLLARLALQALARDHPEAPRPADLRALVPAYLAAVPLAPGGDRPLTLADLPPEVAPAPGGSQRD